MLEHTKSGKGGLKIVKATLSKDLHRSLCSSECDVMFEVWCLDLTSHYVF